MKFKEILKRISLADIIVSALGIYGIVKVITWIWGGIMTGKDFIAEMEKIKKTELAFFARATITLDFENPDFHKCKIAGRDQYGHIWELFFDAASIESGKIQLISEGTEENCEPSLENIYRELWFMAVDQIAELETE